MKAPNLFILGAQKAGTTYLAKALSDHPDVFFSEPKETMFFSRERDLTDSDFDAYKNEYFGDATDQTWLAEGSTTYLQWPDVRAKMQRFITGQTKMIVCMRQPVAKAISFFIHNWRRGRYAPGATISQTLGENVKLSPLETSLYAEAIAAWLAEYPRENFLFLKFDDLVENPENFVRKATDFLGIPPLASVPATTINAGLPLVWENDVLTVRHDATDGRKAPQFTAKELDDLQERFLPDLKATESLTQLDLSDWYTLPEIAPVLSKD